MPVFFSLWAEQDGGERGRERERVEGGDRDGEGDGERELLVEDAGGSGEEADRDEDGDEDERGGDDGAGDLAMAMEVALCGSSEVASMPRLPASALGRTSGA